MVTSPPIHLAMALYGIYDPVLSCFRCAPAYVEHLSPNALAVFNAGQIEKAENCGLVYNVETNDVENPENMTRHQRAGMFGHLN